MILLIIMDFISRTDVSSADVSRLLREERLRQSKNAHRWLRVLTATVQGIDQLEATLQELKLKVHAAQVDYDELANIQDQVDAEAGKSAGTGNDNPI